MYYQIWKSFSFSLKFSNTLPAVLAEMIKQLKEHWWFSDEEYVGSDSASGINYSSLGLAILLFILSIPETVRAQHAFHLTTQVCQEQQRDAPRKVIAITLWTHCNSFALHWRPPVEREEMDYNQTAGKDFAISVCDWKYTGIRIRPWAY